MRLNVASPNNYIEAASVGESTLAFAANELRSTLRVPRDASVVDDQGDTVTATLVADDTYLIGAANSGAYDLPATTAPQPTFQISSIVENPSNEVEVTLARAGSVRDAAAVRLLVSSAAGYVASSRETVDFAEGGARPDRHAHLPAPRREHDRRWRHGHRGA